MAALISVVGNAGVGKTTFVGALQRLGPFASGLEEIEDRPFKARFATDLRRHALANQLDFFFFRAEQERALRAATGVALVDGGLDLDFYGFTYLFRRRGFLDDAEFALCRRAYAFIRDFLPPPELILYLEAPLPVIRRRHRRRGRSREIAQESDLAALGEQIGAWLGGPDIGPVLRVDAADDDFMGPDRLASLLPHLLAVRPASAAGDEPVEAR